MKNGGFRSGSWSPKGRKKAIREFTLRNGLWLICAVTAVMLFIFLLWGLDFIRFDVD